jgi:6-phosphogluconate dehydrogenase
MGNGDRAGFGMMGLGVMGQNLVLNLARNGYTVAVWEKEANVAREFAARHAGERILPADSPESFAALLERPRKIMIMVKAGPPVDWTIEQVRPYLEPGDILIDGGNSHFRETQRREKELAAQGRRFIGSGVSGGESGALWGPSLMPGGSEEAYREIAPIFQAIAAKTADGPCVTYVGADGAGHFVKMVHNGIEYGDMQLIAEAYDVLRRVAHAKAEDLAGIFRRWNEGPLESYLIEITAAIFRATDPETKRPLVELIVDAAGQKGTGLWTSEAALELGVPIPTIDAAITARLLSAMKEERSRASKALPGPKLWAYKGELRELIDGVHDALYAAKICCYAQGMALIQAGAKEHGWTIDLQEISRIWKGGCIIRARFLDRIQQAYARDGGLPNLLLDSEIIGWIDQAQARWRRVVSLTQARGIPCLAGSASLSYYDSYRAARLPQNLTQAQRDYFGAHLYQRIDQPERGMIHTDWAELVGGGADEPRS